MKFGIREKLIVLMTGLSLALIIASVMISSRLYSDSLEKDLKDRSFETADSLTENLDSELLGFITDYTAKIRAVYEANREELEQASTQEFENFEKREAYYDKFTQGIFPPKGLIGMSYDMLMFNAQYESLCNKMDMLSFASGTTTASVFYYDRAHGNIVYLVDRQPESSTLYHFPVSVEKPWNEELKKALDNRRSSAYLEDAVCYGLDTVDSVDDVFVLFGDRNVDFQRNVHLFSLYTLGIMLAATLVIAFVMLFFANRLIVRNVKKLTAASENFASGMKAGSPEHVSASIASKDEIGDLSKQFDLMQESILGYVESLAEQTAREEKMKAELTLAARIQSESLPKGGLRAGAAVLESFLKPAREVGGDLYDYFMLDEKRLFFCLADVSGKGIPAALFMMRAKEMIKAGVPSAKDLGDLAHEVNNKLCAGNVENIFITAFFGVLDTESGRFSYLRAGHEQPFLRRKGEAWQFSEESNFVMGVFEDAECTADELQLEAGDSVLLFTDGLNEGINAQKEEFGYDRIAETLRHCGNDITGAMYSALVDFCGEEEQFDDVTMLAISFGKTKTFSIDSPAYEDIPAVTDRVLAELADLPEDRTSEIGLMIDEIMNNEVSYAFEKTASPHINVILERFGNEVSLTFEDNGAAFDPLQEVTQERLEESEGGFGLSLVKAFSNAQHYERAGETNRLTVTKKML